MSKHAASHLSTTTRARIKAGCEHFFGVDLASGPGRTIVLVHGPDVWGVVEPVEPTAITFNDKKPA